MGQSSSGQRQCLIEVDHPQLSLRRQCELLKVNRCRFYYKARETADADNEVNLLNEIRAIWEQRPFYGYRRITQELRSKGYPVNRKRVQRLMRVGGIQALYPGPNTSKPNKLHKKYTYLLRDLAIVRANQAWMVDISYLRLAQGFVYLVALIDVYSRYVVGWQISNTLETHFCIEALEVGLKIAQPEIINSDMGCQFTSEEWITCLEAQQIKVSMTGKGRCLDNVYIERFWRSVKQEEFYLNDYADVKALKKAIGHYIEFYNNKRWHQALNYRTPADVYFNGLAEEKPEETAVDHIEVDAVLQAGAAVMVLADGSSLTVHPPE